MSLDNHILARGPITGPLLLVRAHPAHRKVMTRMQRVRQLLRISTGRARHVLPRPHRWSTKFRARVTGVACGGFLALLVAVAMVTAVTG